MLKQKINRAIRPVIMLACLHLFAAVFGDDTRSIVNVILAQDEDRYDFVESLLNKKPEMANAFNWQWKLTLQQNGKGTSEYSAPIYAINAAIDKNDFRMVKLLAYYNGDFCESQHLAGEFYACSVRYAAEKGTPEMHKLVKELYIVQAERTHRKRIVMFGSDMSRAEREEWCDEFIFYHSFNKETEVESRARAKDTCLNGKEFVQFKPQYQRVK